MMIPFLITLLFISISCTAMENATSNSTKTDSEQKQEEIAAREAWLNLVKGINHTHLLNMMYILQVEYTNLRIWAKQSDVKFIEAFKEFKSIIKRQKEAEEELHLLTVATPILAEAKEFGQNVQNRTQPIVAEAKELLQCAQARKDFFQLCNLDKWHETIKKDIADKLKQILMEKQILAENEGREFDPSIENRQKYFKNQAIIKAKDSLLERCKKLYSETHSLFNDALEVSTLEATATLGSILSHKTPENKPRFELSSIMIIKQVTNQTTLN